jgi:hypothetical protein
MDLIFHYMNSIQVIDFHVILIHFLIPVVYWYQHLVKENYLYLYLLVLFLSEIYHLTIDLIV